VANGRWQEAADIYWALYDQARGNKAKKELLLLIVRNEQWGNRLPMFFGALDARLGSLPSDQDLLKKLAKLALAANRLDLAEKFVRQMMQFSQADELMTRLAQWAKQLSPIRSAQAAELVQPKSKSGEEAANEISASGTPDLNAREWETGLSPSKHENPPLPKAVFDDEAFTIAYQVFLSKAMQEDAYKVAASAVRQSSKSAAWRQRLAQVSEWTQRPDEALSHWLFLAQHAEVAATLKPATEIGTIWGNVERLAKALHHLPVQLLVLENEQALDPRELAWDSKILTLEETLGRTEQAVARLQLRIKHLGAPANLKLFELLIGLAARLQNSDLLMSTSAQMEQSHGVDIGRSLQMADALAERGNLKAAFELLSSMQTMAKDRTLLSTERDKKIRYWSSLGEYAHALQKTKVAIDALSQALELGSAQGPDLELLANLLEETSVAHAARVMFKAFQLDGKMSHFKRAASLWLQGDAYHELRLAMGFLTDAQREDLLNGTDFLKARATYFQAQGRFQEALNDYRSAIRQNPKDVTLRTGLIWLLMAAKKAPALEQVLRQGHGVAMKESAYWGAYGAAYLTLGEPQKALPFFAKQAKNNEDYLWRLGYADALENAGLPDPAWTLRRKAWTELQKTPVQQLYARPDTRDRVVALALQFAPADAAKKLLATLVKDRELRVARFGKARDSPVDTALGPGSSSSANGEIAALASSQLLAESVRRVLTGMALPDDKASLSSPDPPASRDERVDRVEERAGASELALSYMLSKENVESARAWLLTRYANALSRPAWAKLSVALATQDKTQLAKLLDDVADWLPRYDRVEAMKQLGRLAEAQTSAFETLASRPDNQEAYRSFLSTLSEEVTGMSLSSASGRFSDLTFHDTTLSAAWRFNQRWLFNVIHSNGKLEWDSPPGNLGTVLPLRTQKTQFGAKAVIDKGFLAGMFSHNKLLGDFNSLQGEWQANFERGWGVNLKLGHHILATETPALRVGGMKDSIETRISHQITGRDSAALFVSAARYLTQENTLLGSGFNFKLEYGHQIEKLQPGWTLKMEVTRAQFNRLNGSDRITDLITPVGYGRPSEFFLPNSYTQADIFLSTTERQLNQGRGPIQPFAQLGIRYNSLTGAGYNLRAGLAGSLFGHDSFLLYLQSSSATPGSTHGSSEVGVKYNYFF
jgi:polysaccharide biosynthesis protein PelB